MFSGILGRGHGRRHTSLVSGSPGRGFTGSISEIGAVRSSACDARLRTSSSSASRSASASTSGTSFGLDMRRAYNLQTNLRLGTLASLARASAAVSLTGGRQRGGQAGQEDVQPPFELGGAVVGRQDRGQAA